MKARAAVDSMPRFKGLGLQASQLMLAAKAHSAKGEPFEAAVRWREAGRAGQELAQALAEQGYAYAAAQDFLSAVQCFLESGDYRPAEAVLEQVDVLPQVSKVLTDNVFLRSEHKRLAEWCDRQRDAFKRMQRNAARLMREPGRADRLTDRWLNNALTQFPGVPECHWFAARKHTLRDRPNHAIDHYRLCAQLRPDHVPYRVIFVERLLAWRRWNEAKEEAELALTRFPTEPFVQFFAGWAKVQLAVKGRAPKAVLGEAKELFETALRSKQLSGLQSVCVVCSLSLCLARLGEQRRAEQILRWAVREWPIPASELALELLRLKPAQRERHVLEKVPKLLAA